jgi:hypothetical protein
MCFLNLFAEALEVRRMQPAFFVLPDQYTSLFRACQGDSEIFP